ncbi:exported protein of unknown function [Nitrosopumilus adriaticus]|uniref:Uncharacterized protein n=2 Tax=Nitrosopumilus adriaticus TaxID=1580092 RepID=A0A0D5C0K3_9ARCH|nr:exported protein of unknown function [Nitrosopumilus adriaticus]
MPMKTRYKILSIVILGITVISGAFGAAYLIPGMHTDASYHPDYDRDYEYKITGDKGGAGSHTKTELIFTRTTVDEPLILDSAELTKGLYYTDDILFWDWQIYSFENFVFVSWVTSEHSWSDVFLAISNDFGKTFEVKNISQDRNYIDHYKIDFSDESIYFVWHQNFITEENDHLTHLYFTKSDNYGESFGQQKLMSRFDTRSFEFDMEAFDDNVILVWREDTDSQEEKNIWFATSTDRAEWFDREAKLFGARVDVESLDGILHFTGLSERHATEVWYAYSDDMGQTLHKKIVFDADWKLSPYAERPFPKITFEDRVFVEFEMRNAEGEKTHYKVPIIDENEKEVDWSDITLMKPNSVEFFYYPDPEDKEDTHQLFMLIRLPEWMGGAENDVSAFRAYSAKALDDPCIVKYWPDVGRQRIENPCQGGMYRVIDGAITYGATHRTTAMTALPYLELSIDKNGMMYVEPPTFTPSENGVVAYGRNMSLDEIRQNSEFLAESFAKHYPKYPPIPTEFAGYTLSEITPENHSTTVRYLDFPNKVGYITMMVGTGTIHPDFSKSNVEYWQIGDTEIKIAGTAMDEDSTTPESLRTYEITFRDGYYYMIEGKNLEFLKKSIISHFFPEYSYDDMFLVLKNEN